MLRWQRISLQHEEQARSTPFRAWHNSDRKRPLSPGEPVAVAVNVWPGALIVQGRSRLIVEVPGRDQKGAGEFVLRPMRLCASGDGKPLYSGALLATGVTIQTGGDPCHLLAAVLPRGVGAAAAVTPDPDAFA